MNVLRCPYAHHICSLRCLPHPFAKQDDRNSASENHPRGTSCAQPKNLRVAEASGHETGTAAFEHEQELDLDGLPCLVKMYDYQDGQLRLNDTTEFVGVLAYDQLPLEDPSPSAAPEETVPDPFRGLESFARKVPPPSLAPRLHCICEKEPLYGTLNENASYSVIEEVLYARIPPCCHDV